MDRPVSITSIGAADDWLVVGGTDPASLVANSQGRFAARYGLNPGTQIAGMHVGGGGDGADWQITYTVSLQDGPGGAGTSVSTGSARVSIAIATDPSEIDRVLDQLRAEIFDATTPPGAALVYQTQVCGGGRDGAYLVALLWGPGGELPALLSDEDPAEQGPFGAETVLATLTVPGQPVSGAEAYYTLDWGGLVNETTGASGVTLELWRKIGAGAFTMIRQAVTSGTGSEWAALAGVLTAEQTGDDWIYELRANVIGGSTVTVRDVFLIMQRATNPGAPS
jgi:hypothetical protein